MSSTVRHHLARASDRLVQHFSLTDNNWDSSSSLNTNTTPPSTVRESDRWTLRSGSTVSLIPDLGMLSGKAILSFGKLQIRVIEKIWILNRRRVIDAKFPRDVDHARLGKMYDDLIDFTREDRYGRNLSSWAIKLLCKQIASGSTYELGRALARTPISVRLSAAFALSAEAWKFKSLLEALRIDEFVEPIAAKLRVDYASATELCNKLQAEILLAFSARWPATEYPPGLWVSRLADSREMCRAGADMSKLDLTSTALFRSGLHNLGRSFITEGNLNEATSFFRRLFEAYNAVCLNVETEQQSLLDVYSALAYSIGEVESNADDGLRTRRVSQNNSSRRVNVDIAEVGKEPQLQRSHATHSTSSFVQVPDFSILSKEAALCYGEVQIAAMKRLWVSSRRHAFDDRFPHDEVEAIDAAIYEDMYDNLINFTVADAYATEVVSWAARLLCDQVRRGVTAQLEHALERNSVSLELATLFAICSAAWLSKQPSKTYRIDNFVHPLARRLHGYYAEGALQPNQAEIDILLTFAVRWSLDAHLPWITHLVECQDPHRLDLPRFDVTSLALHRSGLHIRCLSLRDEGEAEEAASLFDRIKDVYDTICSRFGTQQRGRVDVYSSLAISAKASGHIMHDLDQWEVALRFFEQSVEFYRILVLEEPKSFEENLAETLYEWSSCLSDLAKHEQAALASEEAIQLFQKLGNVQIGSEGLNSGLARSLLRYSLELSFLGTTNEAFPTCARAVQLFRHLARTRPDGYNMWLARSLRNLSYHLRRMGRVGDALSVSREAVHLYDEASASDKSGLSMVMALEELGAVLCDLGRWEEALPTIQKAVRFRRGLVRISPRGVTPGLAYSLNDLSRCLIRVAQYRQQAVASNEEAVKLYRELAKSQPQQYDINLIWALGTHFLCCCIRGKDEWWKGLASIREAMTLFGELRIHNESANKDLKGLTRDFEELLPSLRLDTGSRVPAGTIDRVTDWLSLLRTPLEAPPTPSTEIVNTTTTPLEDENTLDTPLPYLMVHVRVDTEQS